MVVMAISTLSGTMLGQKVRNSQMGGAGSV